MQRHSWLVVLGTLAALQGGCATAAEAARPSNYGGASQKKGSQGDVVAAGGFGPQDATVSDERVASTEAAPAAAPSPPPPPAPPGQPQRPPAEEKSKKESTEDKGSAHDSAMIVYTATITMAVYQVQPNLAMVERIAKEQGGYLSVRTDNKITVRIPRAKFEPTLAAIEKIGDVLHRDVTAEDVTDQYVDLEIRIKNARAMQTRLKQLLEKAAVKEALEIEKELARVTEELELMEGRLKLLKDKIAYSSITVVFEGRGATLTGASKVRLPFPWLGHLGLVNLLQLREERTP
jgi:hypothetical protein